MSSIVLDAGHGGSDPGAVYAGKREKTYALAVALRVHDILYSHGWTVYMTRTRDADVSLTERVDLVKHHRPTAFISIHVNAGGGTGAETWYQQGDASSAQLAQAVQDALGRHVPGLRTDRGIKAGSAATRTNWYTFTAPAQPNDILVEMGFIDTAGDRRLLDTYWPQFADGIAAGIIARLGEGNVNGMTVEQEALVAEMERLGVTNWQGWIAFAQAAYNAGQVDNPKAWLDGINGANAHLSKVLRDVATLVEPHKG